METSKNILAVGLMSGTSADGVDAALVRTNGQADFEFLDGLSLPYHDETRGQLLHVGRGCADELAIRDIERVITDLHVDAVLELAHRQHLATPIAVIGFHGHTIAHQPERGYTRQIGDPQRLYAATHIPVVYDFRSSDMRDGGQGAPLVPLFHQMLFSKQVEPTVVVNLGGVGNLTWLQGERIVAGDTGPGCGLLDAWTLSTTGQPMDRDGMLANRGVVNRERLAEALQLPFFSLPFPKSADRFDFDSISMEGLSPADGAATLAAVTAESVAAAAMRLGKPKTTWVTGGGVKNPTMMRMLAALLGDVRPVEAFGVRADLMEAECFAWLAVRRLYGMPTTLPSTTGCKHPTCGGQIWPPT